MQEAEAAAAPPDITEFFRVLAGSWLALMSGALSVPFAAIATFSAASWTRAIWAAAALFCILVATYQVWARERRYRLDLQKQVIGLKRDIKQQEDYIRYLSSPNVSIDLNGIAIGDIMARGKKCLAMTIQVTVRNVGADSSLDQWEIGLSNGSSVIFVKQVETNVRLGFSSAEFQWRVEEMITRKTLHPVPRGGIVRGLLFGVIEEISDKEQLKKFSVRIACSDVSRQRIYVERPLPEGSEEYSWMPHESGGPAIFRKPGV